MDLGFAMRSKAIRRVRLRRSAIPDRDQIQVSVEHGESATAPDAHAAVSGGIPYVPFPRLLASFLWLGSISMGGRSASYQLIELVERRRWLTREDWVESHLLGKVLPGASGLGGAMFLAFLLRGARAAAAGGALYVIPGIAVGILLSFLVYGFDRPVWADGAIRGLSASALGVFLFSSIRNGPTTRTARLGVLIAPATFLAHGVLQFDLFSTMVVTGLISIVLNRPAPKRQEVNS